MMKFQKFGMMTVLSTGLVALTLYLGLPADWPNVSAGAASPVATSSAPGGNAAATASAPVLSGDPNVFVNLAKKVVPSVVNISTLSTMKTPNFQGGPDDLFRRFFEDFFRRHGGGVPRGDEEGGDEEMPPKGAPRRGGPKAVSLGTGFIIDSSGLILTNNHVVAGADEIKIHFTEALDEKPTDGEVVGRDPEIDVALIRVKSKREMIPISLGDSDAVEVGEYVAAIGNPFGQGHSLTHGIISAKGRIAPDFPLASYFQTDAPINPGNSGGPLVNLKGEVIGINNAIEARAQGIGFAIPINVVKKVLPQLRTKGTVARGFLGVLVNDLTPEVAAEIGLQKKDIQGPVVTHVYPGEPADKGGLKPYDVILSFGGKPVRSASELIALVTNVSVGESIPIKVLRKAEDKKIEEKTLSVKIGQRPNGKTDEGKEPKKKEKKSAPIETGMTLEPLTPEIARELGMPESSAGVLVSNIAYGGPADQAGLGRGDVILEVERKAVKSPEEFFSIVKEKKSYLLRVRRMDGQGRETFSVVVLDLKGPK